jgi:hypothetical protein
VAVNSSAHHRRPQQRMGVYRQVDVGFGPSGEADFAPKAPLAAASDRLAVRTSRVQAGVLAAFR